MRRAQRALGTIAGLLALLFALWAWLRTLDRQTVVQAAEPLRVSGVAHPPTPLPEAGPPAEPETEPAPGPPIEAKREALAVLAEASGLTLVRCPAPASQHSRGRPPGRCVSGPDRTTDCAVDQPAGSARIDPPGPKAMNAPPLSSLIWWTDPSGQTHCVEQAPEPREIRLRIVDAEGRPHPGAYASLNGVLGEGGTADADGRVTLTVYTDAPVKVTAMIGFSLSETVLVAPGEAEIPVRVDFDPDVTEIEALATSNAERAAELEEQRAAIAVGLATAGLSPEAAEVLGGWDAEIVETREQMARMLETYEPTIGAGPGME